MVAEEGGEIQIIDANIINVFLLFLSPKIITGKDIFEQLPENILNHDQLLGLWLAKEIASGY